MGSGWLVSMSNDGERFTDELLYLPYDELCYDCTVSDDVRDVMTKPADVMRAPVVCTRKVCETVCNFVNLVGSRRF